MNLIKSITITLTFVLGVFFALLADDSCSILLKSPGFSTVLVQNDGTMPGWLEIVNNTDYPVRLVNAYQREYFCTLQPYERKSFNYRGTQEIACYKPASAISLDRSKDTQVNCADVVGISKCYRFADTQRSPELHLE